MDTQSVVSFVYRGQKRRRRIVRTKTCSSCTHAVTYPALAPGVPIGTGGRLRPPCVCAPARDLPERRVDRRCIYSASRDAPSLALHAAEIDREARSGPSRPSESSGQPPPPACGKALGLPHVQPTEPRRGAHAERAERCAECPRPPVPCPLPLPLPSPVAVRGRVECAATDRRSAERRSPDPATLAARTYALHAPHVPRPLRMLETALLSSPPPGGGGGGGNECLLFREEGEGASPLVARNGAAGQEDAPPFRRWPPDITRTGWEGCRALISDMYPAVAYVCTAPQTSRCTPHHSPSSDINPPTWRSDNAVLSREQ